MHEAKGAGAGDFLGIGIVGKVDTDGFTVVSG